MVLKGEKDDCACREGVFGEGLWLSVCPTRKSTATLKKKPSSAKGNRNKRTRIATLTSWFDHSPENADLKEDITETEGTLVILGNLRILLRR